MSEKEEEKKECVHAWVIVEFDPIKKKGKLRCEHCKEESEQSME